MTSLLTSLPTPDNAPLRGGPTLRWGILAPGAIATDWTHTVHANTDQRVHAVASRSLEKAQSFAREFGVDRAYGSYQQLVDDPGIDIVYVAAPHSEHRALALLAIAAGKHVLVEKPMGVSAADARVIIDAARSAGVFAMEAMWSRFLPQTSVVARLLADGALGEVLSVFADFGGLFPFDPKSRAFDPALGGGGLLDVGVYPGWFAHFVLGAPSRVTASGSLASTGVDAQAAVILDYPAHNTGHAPQAIITSSVIVSTSIGATVNGTEGRITFTGPFISPSSFRFEPTSGEAIDWVDPSGFSWRDGLCYQATAVAQYVSDGLLEAPLHTLDDTIEILTVLDEARSQLGAK
jgi:predicted dehydrogenase